MNAHTLHTTYASPDKLAHHKDARPKDDVARFLMRCKRQAVPRLANRLRDGSLSEAERGHALHTLSLITGRNYHREANGVEHANGSLWRHG